MAYSQADLKLVSNCGKFTIQVFNGMFQINKLTPEGAFLKLGRISPTEFETIINPLIQKAIKAINSAAPKETEKPKTVTKKQDKKLTCPFKRPNNDLTIGKSYGLFNVCELHCTIKDQCKAICESLNKPIAEPEIEIVPIAPEIEIKPVTPAVTTRKRKSKVPAIGKPLTNNSPVVTAVNESKLSDKSRAHMIALLKTNNVAVSNGITDNALRLLYKGLKG